MTGLRQPVRRVGWPKSTHSGRTTPHTARPISVVGIGRYQSSLKARNQTRGSLAMSRSACRQSYHGRGLEAAVVQANAIPKALQAINGAAGQGEIGDGRDAPSPLQAAGWLNSHRDCGTNTSPRNHCVEACSGRLPRRGLRRLAGSRPAGVAASAKAVPQSRPGRRARTHQSARSPTSAPRPTRCSSGARPTAAPAGPDAA